MIDLELLQERLRALPASPGVYLMRDATGEVIYVGKAVRLRDRVRSYFTSSASHTPKTRDLVHHIADFDVPKLQGALDTDIALLDEMARLVQPIGPQEDNKLQQLFAMMTKGHTRSDRRHLPGDLIHGKVLIFTQYADTAHYLYDNLKHLGRIRAVESDTQDRGRIILRFAPKANHYQLLIIR